MRPFSRRDFMAASALAMAAMPAMAQKTTVAPSEKVRVGLIGCGGMGIGDLDCFFRNPEVDCPVVCDIDDAHLAKGVELVEARRGHRPDTVKDFRRVIDRDDVDVVLVATPDHWHALPTIQACDAGKDVYVEKPLAKSIGEGRAMLNAVQRNGSVVQMGTQWRSGDHYREAIEFVHSGRLGRIRQVRAWAYLDWVGGIGSPPDGPPPAGVDYDMWLGPAPKRPFNPNRFHFNFRWFWDYAGGLMTDWGVHLLNICLWGMGPEWPDRVVSYGGKLVIDDNTETPDTQTTLYKFPGYNLIFEHQLKSGLGPNGRPHGMQFTGMNGTLTIDQGGWEVVPEPKKKDLMPPIKKPAGRDARPAHVRNFLDCVKSREAPVENLELGHFVSAVAHLGNIAFRSGSEITWDAGKETIQGPPEAKTLITTPYRAPWKLPV